MGPARRRGARTGPRPRHSRTGRFPGSPARGLAHGREPRRGRGGGQHQPPALRRPADHGVRCTGPAAARSDGRRGGGTHGRVRGGPAHPGAGGPGTTGGEGAVRRRRPVPGSVLPGLRRAGRALRGADGGRERARRRHRVALGRDLRFRARRAGAHGEPGRRSTAPAAVVVPHRPAQPAAPARCRTSRRDRGRPASNGPGPGRVLVHADRPRAAHGARPPRRRRDGERGREWGRGRPDAVRRAGTGRPAAPAVDRRGPRSTGRALRRAPDPAGGPRRHLRGGAGGAAPPSVGALQQPCRTGHERSRAGHHRPAGGRPHRARPRAAQLQRGVRVPVGLSDGRRGHGPDRRGDHPGQCPAHRGLPPRDRHPLVRVRRSHRRHHPGVLRERRHPGRRTGARARGGLRPRRRGTQPAPRGARDA